MAERAVREPSLNPTASPVDRFVQPSMKQPEPSSLSSLAESLQQVNPKIQKILGSAAQDKAKADEAAGMQAEATVDPTISLENNKKGWKALIEEVRKQDPDKANELIGTSPHFRRGLAKARANRLGRGLSVQLKQAWENNEDGIKSVDSPEGVQKWVSEKAQQYAEQNGLNDIDPVIAQEAYMPYALQAQDQLIGDHLEFRAKSRVSEYKGEFSSDIQWALAGGGTGASDTNTFLRRLTGSESSGVSTAHRTNKDGREFAGLVQMGQGRLDEWAEATGNSRVTPAQYAKMSESEQLKIARWHINDIDKTIKEEGYLGKGWSLDGLRAVAHLGGKGGMRDFVQSKGEYNPSDELGTDLRDYYRKFSSASGHIQNGMNEAIANGVPATEVNEQTVNEIIATAKYQQDVDVLNMLDDISAGSGPLGNIGWVKEARVEAEDAILDEIWETENRERKREEQAEKENKRELKTMGYRTIMEDPMSDHSDAIAATRDAGYPALARDMLNFQRTLQSQEREIITDHDRVIELRSMIRDGQMSDEELNDLVVDGVRNGDFSSNQGKSLIDDIGDDEGILSKVQNSAVQSEVDSAVRLVAERFNPSEEMFPAPGAGELEQQKRREFRNAVLDEVELFARENEGVTPLRLKKVAREEADKLLKSERFQKQEPQGGGNLTELDSQGPPGQDGERSGSGSDNEQEEANGTNPFEGRTEAEVRQVFAQWKEQNNSDATFDQWRNKVYEEAGYTPPEEEEEGFWSSINPFN